MNLARLDQVTGPVQPLLAGMVSPNLQTRQAAQTQLLRLDATALPALADAMGNSDPATAKAAKLAMERLVHHLLAPSPGSDHPDTKGQNQVAETLSEIAASARPRAARACAVMLLGFAGTKRQDKLLARLENDRDIGDDARMARARLKGTKS